MRAGITTDHGGLGLKEELVTRLETAGHKVYPDYALRLAGAVVAGRVDRGIAICGSGVRASVHANKVNRVWAALIHDHFSAKQRGEDDHMNILCLGRRTVGPSVARDLSKEPRHLWRLGKVACAEAEKSLVLEYTRGGSYVCNDS